MRFLLLIFIFLSSTAYSQKKHRKKGKDIQYYCGSLDIVYGNKISTSSFSSQLNRFNAFSFNKPSRVVGLGISSDEWNVNPTYHMNFQLYYLQYLPAAITIHDSIKSNLGGFSFNFGAGRMPHNKKKTVNVLFFLGFNTGRTVITGEKNAQYTNPYFAPKICIQPKFVFWRIALSIIFDYHYDISNPAWKRSGGDQNSPVLSKFNQSGYTAMISLGYIFFRSSSR